MLLPTLYISQGLQPASFLETDIWDPEHRHDHYPSLQVHVDHVMFDSSCER